MSSNVIFIHPDGADPSHFAAARFETVGPDGRLNWDTAPESSVYLGHLDDAIVATSNAGAVTHAYGIKSVAPSFGFDGEGAEYESLAALQGQNVEGSGEDFTILEEAAAAGRPTAVINSGFIAEPGTGVFFADAVSRSDRLGITAQLFFDVATEDVDADGNIVVDPEAEPRAKFNVVLGAGEIDYLPEGTIGVFGEEGTRTDGINLVEVAEGLGYEIVYTLEELQSLPAETERVLGIFAADDTYNDIPEGALIENGFVTEDGELITYGQPTTESNVDDEGFALDVNGDGITDPPTVGDMLEATLGLNVFSEEGDEEGEGFYIVLEEEGTDNFGNNNNARGTIDATLRADEAIGAAIDFIDNVQPNTFVITAADSAGGSLEVDDRSGETVGTTIAQGQLDEAGEFSGVEIPYDGTTGSDTAPFVTGTPDANGDTFEYGVLWAGLPDFAGSIVTKAFGAGAERLPATIDNTGIYRLMYESLFDVSLASPEGVPDDIDVDRRIAPEPTADTGNVIFIHPDGASPSHYAAARFATVGTDGRLNWDQLSDAGVYLGHIDDRLVATSNAGAVVHAYGIKPFAGSFGFDAPVAEGGEEIVSLSGVPDTILQEAQDAGKAVGIVNSGFIAEPGTGVFVADVDNRGETEEITAEILENLPDVILGAGETDYLPEGTVGVFGQEGTRTDGRNLIEEAEEAGYTVVFTLDQLQAVDPDTTDRLLGIFAAEDTYNDLLEDQLREEGLVQPDGELVIYGQPVPEPNEANEGLVLDIDGDGFTDPPTLAEMIEAALPILDRDPDGFLLVTEEEATDNLANDNNAQGAIQAAIRADDAIGVALDFVDNTDPNTLIITAADSDAGGLEVDDVPIGGFGFPNDDVSEEAAGFTQRVQAETQAFGDGADGFPIQVDDVDGSNDVPGFSTDLFEAFATGAPDANGDSFEFGVAWASLTDVNGGIVSKAYGLNSETLPATADNTDIYRIMYRTLFGIEPEEAAALRGDAGDDGPSIGSPDGDVILGGIDTDAIGDTILAGAGDDEIILIAAGADASGNLVLAGSGDDTVFVSVDDNVFGGGGADTLITGAEEGSNNVSGGDGDDTFVVEGSGDRLLGDAGDDTFLIGAGGDNILFGGEGADTFVIIDDAGAVNTIADFESGTDVVQIAASALGEGDLTLAAGSEEVVLGGETIAILAGADVASLAVGTDIAFV